MRGRTTDADQGDCVTTRFISPFDVPTPAGAEGWQSLYSYSSLFSEGRREYEDSRFWFQDGVHWPQALSPWDATLCEFALASLSQYNTRQLRIPASNGIDFRILNGYVYLSPVAVPPEEVMGRSAEFVDRAGFYYRSWHDLYAAWLTKVRALIAEIESLDLSALPESEDADEVVKSGSGVGSGWRLQEGYHRLLDLAHKVWQFHFEFLNLGYAAYLDFFSFCKREWPNIPDLAIARMVAGVDVDLFRPDDELKGLARLAVDLGLDEVFDGSSSADVVTRLEKSSDGREWLDSYHDAADPWFEFSTGSGFAHSDPVWIDHPDIPFGFIRDYILRIRRGEDLQRPIEAILAERERIVGEYRELLPDAPSRAGFDTRLDLARTVFPYVENHNFYVEHWCHAVIWRKMRGLGRVLADAGFWPDADDIFLLTRTEVSEALWDHYASWATPAPAAGPTRWPAEVRRRASIVAALRARKAEPALGIPPEVVTEPFTIMLWGITSESVSHWLGTSVDAGAGIRGFAASPGVAEGLARVIESPAQINEVLDGEILVAPLTAPSWAPIFGRIGATVTDTGGMMSHAAIVCREYGLPAVTGTGVATSRIVTGQRIRVDGTHGTVTFLE